VRQQATFDTSFWINAHRSGLLPPVLERFVLWYAPDVAAEMRESFPSGQEFWLRVRSGELRETAPAGMVTREFGRGERAAINLAAEHRDWTLLVDDYRPYQEADRLGLRVLCTPTLAVILFEESVLTTEGALTILARLARMQTVSPHLLTAALTRLGRRLEREGNRDDDDQAGGVGPT
jgi:predicted nucleic acid-binding protein